MENSKRLTICLGAALLVSLLTISTMLVNTNGISTASAQTGSVVSTEVIDYAGMSSANVAKLVSIFAQQKLPEITVRLNAFNEFRNGQPNTATVATTKQIMTEAAKYGIRVNVDIHTWYTTWDTYFRDTASSHDTNRAKYITYVKNSINAFSGYDVATWMVLNEPQARKATASENQFILDIIAAAKSVTSKPVSVRFMGGYSPDTGYYSSSIDSACGFLCRNVYWDPRSPSSSRYGVSSSAMQHMISNAKSLGKQLWITEFGKTKNNLTEQANYIDAFINYGITSGIDKMFAWVSKPLSGASETYNIFGDNLAPYPAFYKLKSTAQIPQPPTTPEPTPAPSGTTIFANGFESGSFTQWTAPTSTSGETATVVNTLAREGTYSAKFTTNGQGGTERAYISKSLPTSQSSLYVRAYFYIDSGLPLRYGDGFDLFTFRSASGTIASAGVRYNNGASVWYIAGASGSWYATSGPSMDRWYCVEFYVNAESGSLTMWVNGVNVLSRTGISRTSLGSISSIDIGLARVSSVTSALRIYCDSCVLSSAYVGPIV